MICDNCFHQKACIAAFVSCGRFIEGITETNEDYKCKYFEDKTKIQNAIEKQIPKKVKNLKKDSDIGACIPETKSGHCPVCDVFLWGETPYCNYCGQALDWGD